ncbi:hypothetical protein IJ090_02085 [Candidatus Saccharibacteria bacterium]|nr:hypothetical protein [Candidatus Saccharibacteria bacterium]
MIAEIIMAACAIATIIYTVKTNNDTAKENRKTAELNNKMAELKYRQLIIDANSTFIDLSQNTSGSGVIAVNFALEQLLNAYEVICYLKRDEIDTEDFRALYGNEMLEILKSASSEKRIKEDKYDYKYIRKAVKILENK